MLATSPIFGDFCDMDDNGNFSHVLEQMVVKGDRDTRVPDDATGLYLSDFAGQTLEKVLKRRLGCGDPGDDCSHSANTGINQCIRNVLSIMQ
jgi:hypothetical protein